MQNRLHVEANILVKPDLFVSPDVVDFGTVSRAELLARSGAADPAHSSLTIVVRGTIAD